MSVATAFLKVRLLRVAAEGNSKLLNVKSLIPAVDLVVARWLFFMNGVFSERNFLQICVFLRSLKLDSQVRNQQQKSAVSRSCCRIAKGVKSLTCCFEVKMRINTAKFTQPKSQDSGMAWGLVTIIK